MRPRSTSSGGEETASVLRYFQIVEMQNQKSGNDGNKNQKEAQMMKRRQKRLHNIQIFCQFRNYLRYLVDFHFRAEFRQVRGIAAMY